MFFDRQINDNDCDESDDYKKSPLKLKVQISSFSWFHKILILHMQLFFYFLFLA